MSGPRLRAGALSLLAVAAFVAAPAPASEAPARGDPAARLPEGSHASDVWDLTVALSDGHWVVAQTNVGNLGPAGRSGAIVGHVVDPAGGTHEFHKVRRGGQWALSPDGRRIDLDAIVFDQRAPDGEARFYVGKKDVHLDLWIALAGEPAWSDAFAGDAGSGTDRWHLDLLALAAPVRGTLQLGDGPEHEVTGRAVLTHRWMTAVESRFVGQRLELFALDGDTGLYLSELETPDGASRRWLVVGQGGRILGESGSVRVWAEPDSAAGGSGGMRIESATVTGRVEAPRVLLRDEPLARAPWLARWWLGRLSRPRFTWSAAPFEFTVRGADGQPLRLAGRGLLDVARFGAEVASGAVGSVGGGWGER